jgi:hypothetical protein
MNRTSKLMTTVLASILFNGTVAGSKMAATFAGQNHEMDQSKEDTEVSNAADRIHEWLKTTEPRDAKSLQEVIREFPQFTSTLVEQSLKRLILDDDIKRMGDGSQDNPYRYYGRAEYTA